MSGQQVRIQHTSMQFSDDMTQHRHDAKAVFDRAEAKGVWALSGTEAGKSRLNHDLRDDLIREAGAHRFYIYASYPGEWVAVNMRVLEDMEHGFDGPFIAAEGGKGGHAPRGIAWVRGKMKVKPGQPTIPGWLTFGSVHYLTKRAEDATNGTNLPLVAGIAAWGKEHGAGGDVVFVSGDVNTQDRSRDVFMGKPFTTIADELGKWPATHGQNVIDVIASYDHDGRVKALSYDVLDDTELKLYSDHNALEAVYEMSYKV